MSSMEITKHYLRIYETYYSQVPITKLYTVEESIKNRTRLLKVLR